MAAEDISLDLETLSTDTHATILSIGAVWFDKNAPGKLGKQFHAILELQEQDQRDISASTITWWMQQDEAARLALFGPAVPHTPVREALADFSQFCVGALGIWGNGATFDNVLLQTLYDDFHMKWPLPYYADRDLRTLHDMAGGRDKAPKVAREGTHHDALDDAIYQAHCAQTYFAHIKHGVL